MSSFDPQDSANESRESQKRRRTVGSGSRYLRKRSSKACHVCRARKTKCDNVRPTCGFCTSINIRCSYDDIERDHSAFDPASLEILKQLGQIINSQEDLLQTVRSIAATQLHQTVPEIRSATEAQIESHGNCDTYSWDDNANTQQQSQFINYDWFAQRPDSIERSPAASTGTAAVQWFDLLSKHTSHEAFEDGGAWDLDYGCLDPFNGQDGDNATPLQRATKIIDGQPLDQELNGDGIREQDMWQAPESIVLLDREQILFGNFLHRICPWLDLFDTTRKFSTIVSRLAARNAGLLNAILALSGFHQSVDESIPPEERPSQKSTLQYYYQTLHYVQKAMRYLTYQQSLELMVTAIIVSTYEMFRGSRKDWQHHLKGVFWILRSRLIEVEASSLESTTWWAWLRQDIWAAFREKRRVYSTWVPKKTCSELNSYEIASRAVWILAQVVNFCAIDPSAKQTETALEERIVWARALRRLMEEWESNLTIEFSELPAMGHQANEVFRPRMIHPQCFGLSMQVHHVSRILICAHEPSYGGMDNFMARQKTIQDSIEVVCGIGTNITDDASSMMSSQCLFIAGIFVHNTRQRTRILEMLDQCRSKCGWPTRSLSFELEQVWARTKGVWDSTST